jgi:hypothetical protein
MQCGASKLGKEIEEAINLKAIFEIEICLVFVK